MSLSSDHGSSAPISRRFPHHSLEYWGMVMTLDHVVQIDGLLSEYIVSFPSERTGGPES